MFIYFYFFKLIKMKSWCKIKPKTINVPVDYSNERPGRLKRQFGFEMNDMREYVMKKSKQNAE